MDRKGKWLVVGFGVLLAGIVTIFIVNAHNEHQFVAQCEDNGGHVEKYDCSTTFVPVSCGSGCTVLLPVENCSSRCIGASMEAKP